MTKIINLKTRIKQHKKKVLLSPHVLDLKKIINERQIEIENQNQTLVKKISTAAVKRRLKIVEYCAKPTSWFKQKAKKINKGFKVLKLKLVSRQVKFKPEIAKLLITNRSTKPQLSIIEKTVKINWHGWETFFVKKIKPKIEPKFKFNKKFFAEKIYHFGSVNVDQDPVSIWFNDPTISESEKPAKKLKSHLTETKKESEKLKSSLTLYHWQYSFLNIFLLISLALVAVLPVRGWFYFQELRHKISMIINYASAGANYLQEAKAAGLEANLPKLAENFSQAQTKFILAKQEINQINDLTQLVISFIPKVGNSFVAGEKVLDLGNQLSLLGQNLVATVNRLEQSIATGEFSTSKLTILQQELAPLQTQLNSIENLVNEIKLNDLPAEYRDEMGQIKSFLPKINHQSQTLLKYLPLAKQILGDKNLQRYLLVFQNNNEIRPTGGFVGSYALMDINQGKITNLEIPAGGSYDLEGGEIVPVLAPQPLWLINPRWHFWDANWFFDFPTSAEKTIEFYNSSGGPTVDGVLAINATLMQKLISIVGPIKVAGYEPLTGENFINLLQSESEKNKTTQTPKQLLSLAGPLIVQELTTKPEKWLEILPLLEKSLAEKELQVYFTAYDLQKAISDLDWGGQIKDTDKDYLAVVHTNLGGGKTDRVIKNEVWHRADIAGDGSIEDTLILTRSHQGDKGDIFTGAANNDYIRVYLPLGSQLLAANGFSQMPLQAFEEPMDTYQPDKTIAAIEKETEIVNGLLVFTESNKTVFAGWLHLEPGETKSVYLKYLLPFTISSVTDKEETNWLQDIKKSFTDSGFNQEFLQRSNYYSLLIQKQSGLTNTNFISSVKTPTTSKTVWNYPSDWQFNDGVYSRNDKINQDMVEVLMLE